MSELHDFNREKETLFAGRAAKRLRSKGSSQGQHTTLRYQTSTESHLSYCTMDPRWREQWSPIAFVNHSSFLSGKKTESPKKSHRRISEAPGTYIAHVNTEGPKSEKFRCSACIMDCPIMQSMTRTPPAPCKARE